MAHSFLIFDFGTNEEAAQQARHKLEGWKQGFRLDKKILLKFEREETEAAEDSGAEAAKHSKGPKKSAAKSSKPAARSHQSISGRFRRTPSPFILRTTSYHGVTESIRAAAICCHPEHVRRGCQRSSPDMLAVDC